MGDCLTASTETYIFTFRITLPVPTRSHSTAIRWLSEQFSVVNNNVPRLLNLVHLAHRVVGPTPLQLVSSWLNQMTNHLVPVWNPYMPKGAAPLKSESAAGGNIDLPISVT